MVSGDPKPPSCYKGAICVAVNTSAERIFIATNIKLTPATNVASNTKVTTIETRFTRECFRFTHFLNTLTRQNCKV